jgi:hypothetical protein
MLASKENAKQAQTIVQLCVDCGRILYQHQLFLQEFLVAAEKRLPSEAAITKDKARRRVKK